MLKKIPKILKVTSYCFTALVICLSLFVITLRFLGESTSVFGYSFYYVLTGSMEPEIMAGDMILGESVDSEELQVGDVVTYMGESGDLFGKVITHKIVEIHEDGTLITQGVANSVPDPQIRASQVMSKYVTTIPLAGGLFSIINSKIGFILLIATPLGLLIINEVSNIAKAVKEEKEDKEEHLSE